MRGGEALCPQIGWGTQTEAEGVPAARKAATDRDPPSHKATEDKGRGEEKMVSKWSVWGSNGGQDCVPMSEVR